MNIFHFIIIIHNYIYSTYLPIYSYYNNKLLFFIRTQVQRSSSRTQTYYYLVARSAYLLDFVPVMRVSTILYCTYK